MPESRRAPWLALALCALVSTAHAADPQPLHFHDAVTTATSASPAVTLAQLRLAEADARVTQARGALLPSVGGSAFMMQHTFNIAAQGFKFPGFGPLIGPLGMVDARVRIAQPVLDLAAWMRVRAARYGQEGARADQAATGEQVAQGAALAWLRAARAEASLAAREQDLALAKDLLSLAEAQFTAGTSPAIDVTRARTQVAASQGAAIMARNQRDRARLDLARAIGLDGAAPVMVADSLDAALGASDVPEDEDALVRFAIEHRVELMNEDARLQRARTDRLAIRAERLPRLEASADWGPSGQHWGDAIDTRQYGLALALPLFDGGRREGRLHEQDAVVRESEVRLKDLHDQVAMEVRAARLDLASGLEQGTVAHERVRLAEEEVAQARDRFVSGVAGNIEVINAQSSLLRARDADIDARFAVASARVALARAAGVARLVH